MKLRTWRWWWRRGVKIERTLDRGMKYGRDGPVSILPVSVVMAVPTGPVGWYSGRWNAGSRGRGRDDAVSSRRVLQCGTIEVLVQLLEFQLDVVHGSVDLGTPILHLANSFLQADDAHSLRRLQIRELLLPNLVPVGETLDPGGVVLVEALGELVGEALGYLVEEDLVRRIHGTLSTLEAGKVFVRWKVIQTGIHATNRLSEERNYEIPRIAICLSIGRAQPDPVPNQPMEYENRQ